MGHRRTVRRATLAVLAGAVLAACGGTQVAEQAAPGETSAPTPTPTGRPTGSATPAAAAKPPFQGALTLDGLRRLKPGADAPVAETVAGINAFAARFQGLAADPDENFVSSPLSVAYAFAMLAEGAKGETAKQLDAAFGFPEGTAEAINALTRGLVTSTAPPVPRPNPKAKKNPDPKPPVLTIANALFAQAGYDFRPAFLRTVGEQFDGEIRAVEFGQEKEALAAINGWVSRHTAGRIPKILERLDPDTVLALANAVYLRANWQERFSAEEDGTFVVDGNEVGVPAIHDRSKYGYATGAGWRAVTLPYFGGRLAMRVLLPTGDSAPADLLNARTLAAAGRTTSQLVDVTMPKWDFATQLDLTALLPKLGVTAVFDPSAADLSGVTAADQLFVDQALHRANVTVDELGTEAAAVTVVTAVAVCACPEPPSVDFVVDRPFVFQILDRRTGVTLFLGQVVDPRAK